MKSAVIAGAMLMLTLSAATAAAQPRDQHSPPLVGHLPRTTAERLLNGRAVPTSFDELRTLLEAGHEVVVTDEAGHVRRGRVARIGSQELALRGLVNAGKWEVALALCGPADAGVAVKRKMFPTELEVLPAASIARVAIVDPAGDGAARGATAGAAIAAAIYLWERRQPDTEPRGLATLVALTVGIPISIRMGHVLDRAVNRLIYESPRLKPRVEITPLIGSGIGVGLRARF